MIENEQIIVGQVLEEVKDENSYLKPVEKVSKNIQSENFTDADELPEQTL